MRRIVVLILVIASVMVNAQNTNKSKFKQLKEEWRSPNAYRNAAGAPGYKYYQQQADYNINVTLNDKDQSISGEETITYTNNSPDDLEYLWVQLDQNIRAQDSDAKKMTNNSIKGKMSFRGLEKLHNDFDGGFKLGAVTSTSGKALDYTVVKTMMRINLATPLKSGSTYSFKIKYAYNINDRMKMGGRSGYEYFEKDDNYLYTIAQFYPRMCVYSDLEGWQNKQFLGNGEFALPFGDYTVAITVPADHIVGSTGTLQNASKILTAKQRELFKKAETAEKPVIIVSQEEAEKKEASKSDKTKTWIFKATNVRDFAFASSRKFIWDAKGVKVGGKTVMAMSYYPKEGNPLWEKYSTEVVAHTIEVYSKFTVDYPYPVAISVHAAQIGMEYPMICFNYGRPEEDGTYSKKIKYGMMGVIIHEVGHNFFPMIINSDERQWTWMDEGLNTFVQYLTEQEWERDYPSDRGPSQHITHYMGGDKKYIAPIMTNSESLIQFGNNAYGKPAAALNILRETVLGRELFDYAFKVYAERWKFKHPSPEDFFRTMEDASGVDLDWFWRGWFYTTDHVDVSINEVNWYKVDTRNPSIEKPFKQEQKSKQAEQISEFKNKTMLKETVTEKNDSLNDFYNKYNPFEVTLLDQKDYDSYIASLNDEQKALINAGYNYYEIKMSNEGGLITPLVFRFDFVDGSEEIVRIPAEVWIRNEEKISKVFFFKKEVQSIKLDPFLEMADCDMSNNYWPPRMEPSKFKVYKNTRNYYKQQGENLMQKAKRNEALKQE